LPGGKFNVNSARSLERGHRLCGKKYRDERQEEIQKRKAKERKYSWVNMMKGERKN